MAAFNVINLLAIRLVLRVNNAITWWKLAVPALTVIALIAVHFRAQNFFQYGFAPAGLGGTFAAVSGSGIIFTYLGFRQAIELAGESANPSRNLPFAIIGSVLLCILLYCGLQIAFIGALEPRQPRQRVGASQLSRHLRPIRRPGRRARPHLARRHALCRCGDLPGRHRHHLHHHRRPCGLCHRR